MTYDVISAFIDRRTGRQIDPGQPLPEGLDRDTIQRLVAARCLRPLEPETPAPGPSSSTPSGGGTDLFGGAGDGEAGEAEGDAPTGNAGESTGEGDAAPTSTAPNARRPRRAAAAAQ